MKKIVFLSLMAGTALMVTACEKTREQFDFRKRAPDEFAVQTRAPLEIPQDFSYIPTPKPGKPRPQEVSATNMARAAVLGEDAIARTASSNNVSQGEAVLLQRTGASNVNPNIRNVVDKETAEIGESKMPGIDKLKRMVGQNVQPPAKVVDPVAEAQRLKDARAAGQSVTTGETPTLKD